MGEFILPRAYGVSGKRFLGQRPLGVASALWTLQPNPPVASTAWALIQHNGHVILASNAQNQNDLSSDGGITWTPGNNLVSTGTFSAGALYDPVSGHYVLAGDDGANDAAVWYSTDGVNWSRSATLLSTAASSIPSILSNGAGLLWAGVLDPSPNNYATSTDGGVTWTSHATFANQGWGNFVTQLTGVFDGARFVQCVLDNATGHVQVVSSTDGITWTVLSMFSSFFNASLAFGAGHYLISQFPGNHILVASDPTLFNPLAPITIAPLTGNLTALYYDGARFLAFDDAGGAASSTDPANTWVGETLGLPANHYIANAIADPVHNTVIAVDGSSNFPLQIVTRSPL